MRRLSCELYLCVGKKIFLLQERRKKVTKDLLSFWPQGCARQRFNSPMSNESRLLVTGPTLLYQAAAPILQLLGISSPKGSQLPASGWLFTALLSREKYFTVLLRLQSSLMTRIKFSFPLREHPCLTFPPSLFCLPHSLESIFVWYLKNTPAINHLNPGPCLNICL